MRLGFFQGEASEKSLSRIYPVEAKRKRDPKTKGRYLVFFKAKPPKRTLVESIKLKFQKQSTLKFVS
jgi:hypothetical protein